jgi:hypothetical protein
LQDQTSESGYDVTEIVKWVIDDQFRSYYYAGSPDQDSEKSLTAGKENSDAYREYYKSSISQVWIYAHILFSSPHFYSAHVKDKYILRDLLYSIVGKARLPSKENMEGLMVLRSAWDMIDIGHFNLHVYKYLSKFIYLFILVSGIATVCLNVFTDNINSSAPAVDSSMTLTGSLVFYLSIVTTFVTAFNAYFNPSGRWRQIRDSVCNLESAIWQYRTRCGLFKIHLH